MKKTITNRDLYTLITKTQSQLTGFYSEFRDFKNEVNVRFKEVHERFDDLEERVFPRALDREDLEARVSYIEKKLKIKSGK